ncbi:unnamed protein product [Brachionus calyciflorus]|uniref:Serine/threonine-protein phosphatase 6 regulatory subunit 3 n=1 Tax=Brachionus calyciflorus TaxID=104777 RepID=A0A814BFY9_9BILA|nr:unnamed protein product [Brachionus calyciflorus]
MFWRFNYSTSQIHTLLDKEDVTLKEIMDEEDVLQECKSNNEKLVNFLIRPENLNELIENSISLPPEDLNEKERFKYSTISSELLTSDVSLINETLIENEAILDKLYSFLANNNQQTVNPLMASYFAKIMGCLINRKTDQFLTYIQKKQDFLKHFLQNINTSAITDILLRLLTTIDSFESRSRIIQWLKDIKLINGIVELFSHEYSNEVHSNASQVLCDLIRISRDQILTQRELANDCFLSSYDTDSNSQFRDSNLTTIQNLHKNSLLDEIESEEILDKLLSIMLESVHKPNSSLVYAIEVLLTLLEPASWSNEIEMNQTQEEDKLKRDKERVEIGLFGVDSVKNSCSKYLSKLNTILHDLKPKLENYKFSNGVQIGVLGQARLSIIKLINRLISLNDATINKEIVNLGILKSIIDMVLLYKWNNFLHTQFRDILINCFLYDFKRVQGFYTMLNQDVEMTPDGEDNSQTPKINTNLQDIRVEDLESHGHKTFTHHFLKDCNLIIKLVHLWSEYFSGVEEITEKKIVASKRNSVGYVGHLNYITNFIRKQTNDSPYSTFLKDCLVKFVESDLVETWDDLCDTKINKLNQLNSKDLVRNPFLTNSTSITDTSDFIELPSDEKMNKKYSELHKEMKINCVEDFSLPESQIVNFSTKQPGVDSNDDSAQMFEQVCQQRDNMNFGTSCPTSSTLDDDVWVKKEIRFSEHESTFEGKDNWAVFSSDKEFHMKIEHKNANDDPSFKTKHSHKTLSSSSSSSSSDDSESSDDENVSTSNKRHHDKIEGHSPKEMRHRVDDDDDDIFKNSVSFKIEPLKDNEETKSSDNWAKFDQVFSTDKTKPETLEINDPWSSPAASSTSSTTNDTKTENWASFDNC